MKPSPMKLRQMKPSQKHAANKCCQTSTSPSLGAWFVIPIEACGETSTSLSLGRWNDDELGAMCHTIWNNDDELGAMCHTIWNNDDDELGAMVCDSD